ISTRLVANQDYQKISRMFKEYFEAAAPDCVQVKVTPSHGGAAYVTPLDTPAYRAAEKAMTETYGKRPIPTRSGGSIPIVAGFEKILGIKSVLMGFGLGSDDIHAPNENYPLQQFFKGIETIPYFYENFAELLRK
ncbi:MAG: M20/M25/M40 family metallo-hydrolase, partial [Bacteroidales bacterium]|nr:M20/M25/M40 family metallo-hydrolase [Bacteroidales bacterium]